MAFAYVGERTRHAAPEWLRHAHAATLNLPEGVECGLPPSHRLRATALRPQHASDAILRIAAIGIELQHVFKFGDCFRGLPRVGVRIAERQIGVRIAR